MLERFEQERRRLAAGETLRREGDRVDRLFVVRSGVCYSHSTQRDGKRQLAQVYLPGDVIGMSDVVFARSRFSVAAAGRSVVCPFPKTALDEIFVGAPRLAALLFSLGMAANAVLADRMRVVARMGARQRVVHFLLELWSRQRVGGRAEHGLVSVPLTQQLIGDAIGLSNVYVNRALGELRREGSIQRLSGRRLQLLQREAMQREVEFVDRYAALDLSWFAPQQGMWNDVFNTVPLPRRIQMIEFDSDEAA
ncbi:Crp/Fnr family transcriptional regulator [Pseudomarimonas salicorniae]|uniref:CRP-like protein Clp n=1 Tax=Pseudomarimonas salicorniae TaxID=2933270 RepID=A0ABT0GFE3_9GAMM|nr:Crp/Fnr family transcriptional regulator [Lysobacter sp. CAU 1642]MCK7593246.1 Crp/Fnr family transcriptional regulator [Lysobacter sp. CAU 1642]